MSMEQNKWLDISSEEWREYIYADGVTLRVVAPTKINISPSSLGGHSHRIQQESGRGIYVAPGWIAIRWEPKPGQPIFTF